MKKATKQKSVIFRRRGGLSLEAAIIMPLVIVAIYFLIQAILLIRIEIVISTALDNTADEIALLIPAIELAAEGTDFKKTVADFDNDWPDDTEIESLLEEAALDLASSVLFGRLIDERFSFWLQKVTSNQEISLRSVKSTKINLEIQFEKNYLLLCQNVEIKTLLGQMDRTISSAVPAWTGRKENYNKIDEVEDSKDDGIWQLGNLSRGKILREKFGANLPFNYPVIAQYINGSAISITSIDLTAPTYENQENIIKLIGRKMTALAEFRGYQSSSADYPAISSDNIKVRKLLLIIPENSPDNFHRFTEQELVRIAENLDVQIQFVQYGYSRRFESRQSGDPRQTEKE